MHTQYVTCQNCRSQNLSTGGRCSNCGTALPMMPPGGPMRRVGNPNAAAGHGADKKLAAGICGILLGAFGVHKFILGYTTEGLIMLIVSLVGGLLLCGIPTLVMGIIGLIEGIIYLVKSDEEFANTYFWHHKGWF